ncbi:MAG: response regulator [Bdellovibrionota bacterium]
MRTETISQQLESKVLLVEDDRDIREAVRDLLELEGYTVVTAENGREALRILSDDFAPKVILLDFLMPVMNGIEFLNEKRKREKISKIPVILLSASNKAFREIKDADLLSSEVCVLAKPLEIEGLIEAVRQRAGA